jgi:hypothetical protein
MPLQPAQLPHKRSAQTEAYVLPIVHAQVLNGTKSVQCCGTKTDELGVTFDERIVEGFMEFRKPENSTRSTSNVISG